MGTKKCGCVVADSKNTFSVRKGFEMSGYIKSRCAKHQKEWSEPEVEELEYKDYKKTLVQQMRPYVEGEDMTHIMCKPDHTPEVGDMVAKGPGDLHFYLVTKEYFLSYYEEVNDK